MSDQDVPAYRRIAADLRAQIASGEFGAGAQLPTEHELAERYGVARQTVRNGLSVLVTEGLVVARRPRGHFVRSREQAMSSLDDLEQRVAALEAELTIARQEVAAARALAAGADGDVADYRGELRGHTRVLGALRDTQLDQGQAITDLSDKVDQLTGTIGHIRDQHGTSLAQIADLLSRMIDQQDPPQ